MKKIITTGLLFFAFIIIFVSCKNRNLSKVKTTPEMEEFMSMLDGKFQSVTDAIGRYASAPDLNTADMDTKDLRDPEIISAYLQDNQTCYTLKSNDGASDCLYQLCWVDGKIVSISDKSAE